MRPTLFDSFKVDLCGPHAISRLSQYLHVAKPLATAGYWISYNLGYEHYRCQGGTETILVAEDEEPLRNLTKDVLGSLGYTVLVAENGVEAIELFAANRDAIDLLLFDVVMPLIGGPEAYKTIREMAGKDIPLILMTGYSSEVLESPYVKRGEVDDFASARVIQKPYTLDALGKIVRDTLDQH